MKTRKIGISLIVLVITIIVMIILASAIILSLSSGDIRRKANDAVVSNDIATAKEIIAIAQSEWELNYDELKGEYKEFSEYANKKLEKAGMKDLLVSNSGAVNIVYKDKAGDTAIIPEGFNVSEVASEQTIDDGLVILDNAGNEFVWVPVDNYVRFERTTTYKPADNITTPSNGNTEPYGELSLLNDLTGEVSEESKMRESVQKYKGFYIARYEAGTDAERTLSSNVTTELVVQKNKPVYNYVVWGASMTNIKGEESYSETGKSAVELSRQMYKDSKSVVSTLCYGVQWDAALQFIATKDADYPTYSKEKGYYAYDEDWEHIEGMEEMVQPTGYYAINNIYDMAGNVEEWTMEASSSRYRVTRGGNYGYDGYGCASTRVSVDPDIAIDYIGFRITLYIK